MFMRESEITFYTDGEKDGWLDSGHRNVIMDRAGSLSSEQDELYPEILFISTFPPRECGIATYTQDLINALDKQFDQTFTYSVCALEDETSNYFYERNPKYVLNTSKVSSYTKLAFRVSRNRRIQLIVVQHEFGLFKNRDESFLKLIADVSQPVIVVFHTVLPKPDRLLQSNVVGIAHFAATIVVMTENARQILEEDYGVSKEKIMVIPHGTHLVSPLNKDELKEKYHISSRKVLSTFGLLSNGKNIESSLEALPAIIKVHPDALFLIIGKTHPTIVEREGEQYRSMLEKKVMEMKLQGHVLFVNKYLPLDVLLEYLQLTDVYLFTSKDRNQAVSGTFSYAVSCGCPVISTPIPHTREVLNDGTGMIVDFEAPDQIAAAAILLLNDEDLMKSISLNARHKMAITAWQNTAIAHALLFKQLSDKNVSLNYRLPDINLQHFKNLTTEFGMLQFSKINHPDPLSGYTLDDNARALIAICMHYQIYRITTDLPLIKIYLNFISHCLQPNSKFLNYMDKDKIFTEQNEENNLEDANGRAVWALGYLLSMRDLLPVELGETAASILERIIPQLHSIHSTRAMAFSIKGLYYHTNHLNEDILTEMADRMVQMYKHESDEEWKWFEGYITYGNSVLPEALLCAWVVTGNPVYVEIAKESFDFLLSKTFNVNNMEVISNNGWLHRSNGQQQLVTGGEQPIEVAYTIMALEKFHAIFPESGYRKLMEQAFSWFLGNNQLHQIIYNPATGGCYDGLEKNYVNLNQGAESTISYLMSRLTIQRALDEERRHRWDVLKSELLENKVAMVHNL